MKTNELTGAALDWAVAKCEGYAGVALQERTKTDWYAPSTDWTQGGPIIEREGIDILTHSEHIWTAGRGDNTGGYGNGPTPLIAAMRCYVASKLGDKIEIPGGLLP